MIAATGKRGLGGIWTGAFSALVALSAVACGKTQDETTTPGGIAEWNLDLTRTRCERDARCESELGPLFTSVEACVEARSTSAQWDQYFGGVDANAELAKAYRLAGKDARRQCLSDLARLPCDSDVYSPKSCNDMLILREPLGEGAPCGSDSPYSPVGGRCGSGLVCGGDDPSCPVCAQPRPVAHAGEVCSDELWCESNLSCEDASDGTRRCTPPPPPLARGAACTSADTCAGHFACRSGTCAPLGAEGSPCVAGPDSYGQCQLGLACHAEGSGTEGACRRLPIAGDPCQRHPKDGTEACGRGDWCLFDEPDAPVGTCSAAPPFEGPVPCSGFGGDLQVCPAGTFRDTKRTAEPDAYNTIADYCLCRPALVDGRRCTKDVQCRGNRCVEGKCISRAADGAACAANDECESFYCDLSVGACASNSCGNGCPGRDRNTDPFDCGACGNVCSGWTRFGSTRGAIAVDAENVYSVTSDAVTKTPLTGGDPVTLASGVFSPRAVAVDRDHLYFTDAVTDGAGRVIAVPLDGSPLVILASNQQRPTGIAVNATTVFWTDCGSGNGDGRVMAAPIAGGSTSMLASSERSPQAIAVDANNVYWTSDEGVRTRRLGLIVPFPSTLAAHAGTSYGIAVDARYVYWTNVADNTVNRIPLPGGSGNEITLATDQGYPMHIAVDGTSVYFNSFDGDAIRKVPIEGGEAATLVSQPSPSDLVVVGGMFYSASDDGIIAGPLEGESCVAGSCQGG